MNRRTFLAGIPPTLGAFFFPAQTSADLVLCPQPESDIREELELVGFEKPGDLQEDARTLSFRLRARAYEAFLDMRTQAKRQHVALFPASCYRSFATQRKVWNNRFPPSQKNLSPEQALEARLAYFALPGTSRHHWGTDVDITGEMKTPEEHTLRANYFATGGVFEDVAIWLRYNADKFGFYRVYTAKSGRTGFRSEPWHYSFAELAKPALQRFLQIDLTRYLACSGIEGSQHFTPGFFDVYKQKFLLGINEKLLA